MNSKMMMKTPRKSEVGKKYTTYSEPYLLIIIYAARPKNFALVLPSPKYAMSSCGKPFI